MSSIESNITIYLDDYEDPSVLIEQIRGIISSFNGRETIVNVIETDDPIAASPITME